METERPTAGSIEERTAAVQVADKRIRGVVPYNVESLDLGGWTEVIEAGAFRDTKLDELRAVVDHKGVPLGRYPATLDVEDRADGLHWSLDPPKSRADVIEAIERGDMKAGSWRMVVGRDRWDGDVRHVEAIAELKDVAIVGAEEPAYGAAAPVEYRTSTGGERRQEGATTMAPEDSGADTAEQNTENTEERTESATEETIEQRTVETGSAGSLNVEQRASSPRRGLAEEFRAHGFPGEVAEISWEDYEQRAVTWSPSINLLNQTDRQGVPLGFDTRYAWTALSRIGVESGVTSVQVLTQTSRSLASAANVIRGIAATTDKAETGTTVSFATVALSGVASIESGIPNVVIEQDGIDSLVENDLRLAVNEGLDKIVNDTFAASGFQAPGSDNPLVSYRKAMTTLFAAGYNPDTLILTPAAAEAIDVMVSGISGGSADFVFTPAAFGPDRIFNLRKVISKVVAAPVVLDSTAYGKLYASPARLARFEESSGKTNTSLVRLELHAACGVERQTAAIRVAAS
jgi:phage head maturation protease